MIRLRPYLKIFLVALLLAVPYAALAEAPPIQPGGTCTTDPPFDIPTPLPGQGLISVIVTNVQAILNNISQTMFQTIAGDAGFIAAVQAMLTLYIAIYGILFTFGMVNITLYDFFIRMVKIGIIVGLLSAGAWDFFNTTVVKFFNQGTDDIINKVTAIATNTGTDFATGPPFNVLDGALAKALSAKMAVVLLATFGTGPYGILYGLLLLAALGSFMKALFTAVWVYLMSLVLKTLLFGLAPIFFAFLLFNRTRHLFDGWLNQVVNASLQPILLFVFFAFFAKLIEASIDNLIDYTPPHKGVPVCWTEWAESVRGSPFSFHWHRFTVPNDSGTSTFCLNNTGGKCWEPFGGMWGFTGPQVTNNTATAMPVFPIDIMTILIFLILAELAGRFNSIVLMIARDLAGASTDLSSMQGALSDWFSPGKDRSDNLAANLPSRLNPDGSRVPGSVGGIGQQASPMVGTRRGADGE